MKTNDEKPQHQEGFSALEPFLPPGTAHLVEPLLTGHSLLIKVKKPRKSKFGDYRPLRGAGFRHQITLNNNLNRYAFLITLLHELAHLYAYEEYRGKVKPHGDEWKNFYSRLLKPFLRRPVFPRDIYQVLVEHTLGPTASSCTDLELFKVLKKYDRRNNTLVLLETLSMGEHFKWRNGLIFQKIEKVRKRYRCIEVRSKRVWFFHPMAEVERLFAN